VDGTGSVSCPKAEFGISSVKTSKPVTQICVVSLGKF
jgi:hypothetical protein